MPSQTCRWLPRSVVAAEASEKTCCEWSHSLSVSAPRGLPPPRSSLQSCSRGLWVNAMRHPLYRLVLLTTLVMAGLAMSAKGEPEQLLADPARMIETAKRMD